MALYAINKIVEDTLILLDENNISANLLSDEDTFAHSIRDVVEGRIEDAVKQVVARAPMHALKSGSYIEFGAYNPNYDNDPEQQDDVAICWREDNSGWMLLPDDFLRLIVFQMSDWDRAVYEPISTLDEDYEMQFCKYAGVRGNVHNPVVAIDFRPEGHVLEFFSCSSQDAYVTRACYVGVPKIEDGTIDIPPKCYQSVVYTIAALVCIAMGNAQQGSNFNELSKSSMV